ncbi:MAG TPA: flagellin, partial [Sphingomonas sp.]|nr:flagellin [Sphingomonas sp.]
MISATRYRALAETHRQTDLAKQIAKLQESVSTGKRLTRPSDDPEASLRISEIRQTQADQVVWANNIKMGVSISTAVDTKLGVVADTLDRAKELVLSGRNDTTSATDRAAIAAELRLLAADLDSDAQANDPTGAPLFPAGTPLSIPVSDTLGLPATASRVEVFDTVSTAAGTKSLRQILTDAADAVEGTSVARATDIQLSLSEIDAGSTHLTKVRTDQGVRAGRFDDAKQQIESSDQNLSEERVGLESTDLTYALAEFQSKQVALQAAQTVFAQANKTS